MNASATVRSRIALVSARFLPDVGGTEMHVAELAPRLAAAGMDVEVVTTSRDGVRAEPAPATYRVRRVRRLPEAGDLYFAPGIARRLATGRYDLVHVQGVHTLVAPIAMLSALRARVPFVVTFHTGGHRSRVRNRLRRVQWRALAPLLRRAAALIAVSEFERELFSRTTGIARERIHLIRNGGALRLAGDVVEDEDLILSVGRLERYKGHDRVISALPRLVARRPRAHLLILGSGDDRRRLMRLAERIGVADRVTIRAVPSDQRETMARLLASAGLVVLLSEYEAHPVAVAEALALGRRVLVAETSGLAEIARDGYAASVPLSASAEEVAEAMHAALGSTALGRVPPLSTWDECARRVIDVYRAAMVGRT